MEDTLVKVEVHFFPNEFIMIDMDEDDNVPLILGRHFMKTTKVIIDVDDGKMKVRAHDDEATFDVFKAPRECLRVKAHPVTKKKEGNSGM